MLFKEIMQSLDKLSAYELQIIYHTADSLIGDPDKLKPIKNYLKLGMQISYFCATKNCEVRAIVKEIKKAYALVVNIHDNQRWNVHFSNINLSNIDLKEQISYKSGMVTRANISVGDGVGFMHQGQELIGKIIKLNPTRVKIKLHTGRIWNVSYQLLFYVLDGSCSTSKGLFIEGEVVEKLISP